MTASPSRKAGARTHALIDVLEPRQFLSVSVPAGFTASVLTAGLHAPTAIDVAADGRVYVAEQGGAVRVIVNGALQSTPFLSLSVDSSGERGLDGIVVDPNFAANRFVYVYYTVPGSPAHNRVARYTANAAGTAAVAGSGKTLLDLEPLSSATNHNGGALHFGKDGKLYVSVGENANGANSQRLTTRLGKMLRINSDGSIPTDNPFYTRTTGNNRAIWAMGLRNPFTFAVQPGTGRMFINDVGQSSWEEIDEGKAGANYGWNKTEGTFTASQYPTFTDPFYAYPHGPNESLGVAITGGTFYNPAVQQFPTAYRDHYFFADYGKGWVKVMGVNSKWVGSFASGFIHPVDVDVAPSGVMYVLDHDSGTNGSAGVIYQIKAS